MIINLAKNITRRSQDTTPIPDIVIARVNKLSYNEPNQFIFTDCIVFTIGDINIIGVDSDAADISKNKSPQDPPHKFQATEES